MLYPVEECDVDLYWVLVLPYLVKALDRGIFPTTPEDVYGAVIDGRFKLFLLTEEGIVRGAGILNVCSEFSTQYLNVYMMSHDDGYGDEAEDMAQVENLAKAMGINYITYYGRKGFFRKHSPLGWKLAQVIMVKEAK